MYEAFYGLKRRPFDITPDPSFMYASPQHKEALASLVYGVREKRGLIVLTGEVGTGKTLIIRCLLEMLGPEAQTAYVINPRLSLMEFFQVVAHDFGLPGDFKTKRQFLESLNEFLLSVAGLGQTAVLIVDEAQNLSLPILEEIRLLMNLETAHQKLLQVVLAGQPELHRIIEFSCMRQFKQRIALRAHLDPLSKKETKEYIRKRLQVAGLEGGELFSPRAYSLIYGYSRGIPRVINVVCDNALLTGYALDKKKITGSLVHEVIRDLEGKKAGTLSKAIWPRDERDLDHEWSQPRTNQKPKRVRWLLAMTAAVGLAVGVGTWLAGGLENLLALVNSVVGKAR